jgi:hypothetical protein
MYLYEGKVDAEHQLRDLISRIEADIRSGAGPTTIGEKYGRLVRAKGA